MTKIIVGVDESEGAEVALRWALRAGELRGWPVTAVLAWRRVKPLRVEVSVAAVRAWA